MGKPFSCVKCPGTAPLATLLQEILGKDDIEFQQWQGSGSDRCTLDTVDAVQSQHWSGDQASIYTMVAYYRVDEKVCHKSFAIIAEGVVKHDTHADFGVAAEWHFHATSHGKGPCDGIGGTIKRLATRATLQGPSDKQIISGRHLYDWCVANLQKITVKYVTEMAWVTAKILLRKRFDNAKTVEGTLQYHSFVPCGDYSLEPANLDTS
ncbi:hypothetical protein FOCC_FOCC012690 [Frankliniella occidentalis]|nr:hypothetical protein FOCC_FOCC012690 [Frankliniella occidentalis]